MFRKKILPPKPEDGRFALTFDHNGELLTRRRARNPYDEEYVIEFFQTAEAAIERAKTFKRKMHVVQFKEVATISFQENPSYQVTYA